MVTRRDFLIKGGQIVALGTMSPLFTGCTTQDNPNSNTIVHKLPQLPYEYSALEPSIDRQTMEIHYGKHHQGYVDKLNKALENKKSLQSKTIEELLINLQDIPEEIRESVRNNGGGHYNHSLFWSVMAPSSKGGGGNPSGELQKAIEQAFGSVEKFKENFATQTKNIFGSGWGWLVVSNGKLEITTTANQDNPISDGKLPILGLDVWEHAYYLKYQNLRGDYIKSWWDVVNWQAVAEKFQKVV